MDDRDLGDVPDTADLRVLSREELEAEVRKRTAELQDVMDTMADVLVTLDPEGRIEMANEAVADVLGHGPGDLEGRPLSVLVTTGERAGDDGSDVGTYSAADLVERLVDEGAVTDIEIAFETADGRVVPMQVSASVMRGEEGVDGYVCVATDVTERKARERELRRKNELLDEFASVVSHDIATPLSIIENKARLVELTGDTAHLEDVYEATEEVQTLVDDLRELARQGERVGETTTVDVGAVAREAWQSVPAKEAELTVDAAPRVDADRDRLRQLLANLLRNAVEHSSTSPGSQTRQDAGRASASEPSVADAPEDAVEHGASEPSVADAPEDSAERSSAGSRTQSDDAVEHGSTDPDGEASDATDREAATDGDAADADAAVSVTVGGFDGGFYVADDGTGIPESERDRVFEQGVSTEEGGTGLGLAIVTRIAEGHGWSVDVTDSEAGGARFEVTTGE